MQAMHCVIFYLISVPLHSPHYPFDSVVLSLNCRFCRPFSNLTLNSISRLASHHLIQQTPPPPSDTLVGWACCFSPPLPVNRWILLLLTLSLFYYNLYHIYIHIVLLDKFLSEPLASPWLTSA